MAGLSFGFVLDLALNIYGETLIWFRVILCLVVESLMSSLFKDCRIVLIHKACRISVARRELYTVVNRYESGITR